MRHVSQTFRSDLTRYDQSFRQAFRNMSWAGTVYLTISVDAFDGAVRRIGTEPALLFGIDRISLPSDRTHAARFGDRVDQGPQGVDDREDPHDPIFVGDDGAAVFRLEQAARDVE